MRLPLYFVWTRGQAGKLSQNFTSSEFECPCGVCSEQRISLELIDGLEKLRAAVNLPISIVRGGGYRCAAYQRILSQIPGVQTVPNSQHTLGNAADPSCSNMPKLISLAPTVFSAVGAGPNQLHVDTRSDKIRRWSYI